MSSALTHCCTAPRVVAGPAFSADRSDKKSLELRKEFSGLSLKARREQSRLSTDASDVSGGSTSASGRQQVIASAVTASSPPSVGMQDEEPQYGRQYFPLAAVIGQVRLRRRFHAETVVAIHVQQPVAFS